MSKSASAETPRMRAPGRARPVGRIRPGRRGHAALEFAVVSSLFFLCLLGAIDISRYFMTIQGLRTFIADSARFGMVSMSDGQCREGSNLVMALGRGGVVGGMVASSAGACSGTPAACNSDVTALGPGVCVSRRETVANGGYTIVTVTVTANVTFNFLVNVFGVSSQNFRDTTTLTFQM